MALQLFQRLEPALSASGALEPANFCAFFFVPAFAPFLASIFRSFQNELIRNLVPRLGAAIHMPRNQPHLTVEFRAALVVAPSQCPGNWAVCKCFS